MTTFLASRTRGPQFHLVLGPRNYVDDPGERPARLYGPGGVLKTASSPQTRLKRHTDGNKTRNHSSLSFNLKPCHQMAPSVADDHSSRPSGVRSHCELGSVNMNYFVMPTDSVGEECRQSQAGMACPTMSGTGGVLNGWGLGGPLPKRFPYSYVWYIQGEGWKGEWGVGKGTVCLSTSWPFQHGGLKVVGTATRWLRLPANDTEAIPNH